MADKERADRLEQSSVDAAIEGLKALLILNGGACLALLTFLASAISDTEASQTYAPLINGMMKSLVAFSVGAGLSVLTTLFAYLANQAYAAHLRYGRDSWGTGERWNLTAIACALFSLVCFFTGVGLIWLAAPV